MEIIMTPSAGMTAKPCRCGKMAEAACNAMPNDWECGLEVPATKPDREDGFERGFVAGWNARGEHDYPTPVATGGHAPQPQWFNDKWQGRGRKPVAAGPGWWRRFFELVAADDASRAAGAAMPHDDRSTERAQIDRYLADPERCMPSEAARMTDRRAEEALDVLRSQLPDVVGEEDEIHRRWAQVGQAFCKNCGFPAKTCVCVPQQVNQQSWQGATARHDP